jgi:alkylation response protein AidB-like acyl-CoA dehydrogenase
MDATLTDEQERIRKTAREFIESEGGIELARRRMEGDESVVDELWSDLAELDYTAITVPPEYDGFGEGMVYLTALLEVTGRYALPGPLPETAAFAVPLIDELGTDDQRERHLTAVARGNRTFSFALYDDRNESLPGAVDLDVDRADDGYRLSGTKTLVPYGGEVDRLVVAGRSGGSGDDAGYDGISLFVVDTDDEAVETRRLDSLDRTRPMYEVAFSDLAVGEDALLGDFHEGGDALQRAADRYTVAFCAMLVGAADRAVELSTEHGNEREQYGQPVGKFQAVKHRIADMWMEMQSARSLVYYAAWALDEDEPDAARSVSAVKTYAADRLHRVFGDDIWNHGGMGFTWDHDGHIYLKQAKAWRNFLGSPEDHGDRLIEERLAER